MFSSKYNYQFKHGTFWLLIFYHNAESHEIFESPEEAENCNTENKFSILNEISQFMQYKEKFEFLLEYPKDLPGDYIRWTQTNFPLNELEEPDKENATGYHPIHISNEYTHNFSGLVKTTINNDYNCTATLLDGMPGVYNWWYSIGMHSLCDYGYNQTQPPGPDGPVKEIYLWTRAFFIPHITTEIINRVHFSYSYIFIMLM